MTILRFMTFLLLMFPLSVSIAGDTCYPDQQPFTPEECVGIDPLQWDDSASDSVIAPESDGIAAVTGGMPPFQFDVAGTGFSFPETPPPDPAARSRTIHAESCGAAAITVTDFCGNKATGQISTSNGRWVWFDKFSPACNNDDLFAAAGLVKCSSYSYPKVSEFTSFIQDKYWVVPRSATPGDIVQLNMLRQSYVCNLWGCPGGDCADQILVDVPGVQEMQYLVRK